MKLLGKKGFTLIEVIVTVAVISIIVVPLFTIFSMNYTAYHKDSKKLKAAADMRHAVGEVMRTFRSARQSSITLIGGTRAVMDIVGEGGEYEAQIYRSADDELIIESGGAQRAVLGGVKSLRFTTTADDRISISISTETPLPFSEPYILTQTYDYKKRA